MEYVEYNQECTDESFSDKFNVSYTRVGRLITITVYSDHGGNKMIEDTFVAGLSFNDEIKNDLHNMMKHAISVSFTLNIGRKPDERESFRKSRVVNGIISEYGITILDLQRDDMIFNFTVSISAV